MAKTDLKKKNLKSTGFLFADSLKINSVFPQEQQNVKKFEYRGYARENLAKRQVKVRGGILKKNLAKIDLSKPRKEKL